MHEFLRFPFQESNKKNSITEALTSSGYKVLARGDQKKIWKSDDDNEVVKLVNFDHGKSYALHPECMFPIEFSAFVFLNQTELNQFLIPLLKIVYFEDIGPGQFYGYTQPFKDLVTFSKIDDLRLSPNEIDRIKDQVTCLYNLLIKTYQDITVDKNNLPSIHMFNYYNLQFCPSDMKIYCVEYEMNCDRNMSPENWLHNINILFEQHYTVLHGLQDH